MGLVFPLLGIALAAILSFAMTWALRPLLLRYALARPNARSSHKTPTPQGGGIAVIGATLIVAGVLIAMFGATELKFPATIFGATLFIAAVGAIDDIKSVPVLPRLAMQALAVGVVVLTIPTDQQCLPAVPLWLERGILLIGGLWFVNLVNFMDGLDLMTVAETVPIVAAVLTLGLISDLPPANTFVAATLGGALLGFVPFNRPVAKVFLGDVGSLPIGLLLGWCLLELAYRGYLTAALLLPLYYLADATVTMLRRLIAGERIWTAHRSHFYQRATDNGITVTGVVFTVFTLNIGLAVLAIASITPSSITAKLSLLATGAVAVAWVMFRFARRR
ncbi:UDP-N-acetylmuramyl pentapeptide phosphotransferase/UDP-N-acetylglucosamine-1-phosphate transferase [Nitrobacter vulgaris]|nr:UDP-N-acetylmuramyl pentapeptide phosphotransferase/UDP-N-acetylglucosamine-1-phosphate transferase [Nitrobacter vulgaris]